MPHNPNSKEFHTVLKSIERIAERATARLVEDARYPFPFRFVRSSYSDHYLVSRVSEESVQDSIINTLHLYRVDAVAIDAGQKRARGRVIAAARAIGIANHKSLAAYKSGGLPTGYSDLEATLAPDGVGLFIEVKAPAWIDPTTKTVIREAGKPTTEQLDFLLSKHERGAIVIVAWSVDDVTRKLLSRLEANRKALAPA